MFTIIGLAISFAIGTTVTLFGFMASRRFVEGRLRYVDAVQSPLAAVIAGMAAAAIAWPIAVILPFVGIGTAFFFGVGVFAGVSSGAREIRRRIGAG